MSKQDFPDGVGWAGAHFQLFSIRLQFRMNLLIIFSTIPLIVSFVKIMKTVSHNEPEPKVTPSQCLFSLTNAAH